MQVSTAVFGEYEGKPVTKYIIANDSGMQASVINYGATVTNLLVPNAAGISEDIVLGFETLEGYINAPGVYMGCICGRYANRIAGGKFLINGKTYQLTKNEGENTLHGGANGFNKVFWEGKVLPGNDGVVFSYCSKDGEEGFPGNLNITITYRLMPNALHIEYSARSDKATVVNLTSHCYFNLSGGKDENIFNHDLQLNADSYVAVDDKSIPTGAVENVIGTAMDFTAMQNIGAAVNKTGGFDHTWVLGNKGELKKAATLIHTASGRKMEVFTTCPGIHFYSGNFISETMSGTKDNKGYKKYGGLCLEAQHYPDSPNHSNFPDTVLQPDIAYKQTTIYNF